MSYKKSNYYDGWLQAAADHFGVAEATILSWNRPRKYTPLILDKHNILRDWIFEKLIERGYSEEKAKELTDINRVSRDQCVID